MMSTTDQQGPPLASTLERRFYPRFAPPTSIFIPFHQDEPEASLLVNISENGLLISAPPGLQCNFVARLSIPLNGLPKPVRVTARVAWVSDTGKLAGIQLLDLGEPDREQIRKWGALISARLPQPHCSEGLPDASSFTSSSEAPDVMPAFSAGTRMRPASDIDRRAVRLLLIATACLVAAVVVIKAAPGNPFARSKNIPPESIAIRPSAQEMEPDPPTPLIPLPSATQVGAPAPSGGAAASKRRPSAPLASTVEHPALTQTDLSGTTAVPVTMKAALESARDSSRAPALTDDPSNADTPLTPDPLALKQPVPEQTRASDDAAPLTVSSNPHPSSSAVLPPNTPVASDRSAPSPGSEGPLAELASPQNRTLEVHLARGSASVLSLPGEHLLESPSLTVHIQRSVRMPPTKAAGPRGIRKVSVGELISHVDPQFVLPPNSPAVSLCVKATIAKDGRIENIKQILGPADLAPAVAKALEEWRYQPTLVDGKAVETQCYVTIQFRATPYHVAKR